MFYCVWPELFPTRMCRNLSGNSIQGPIPSSLGTIPSLEILWVISNGIWSFFMLLAVLTSTIISEILQYHCVLLLKELFRHWSPEAFWTLGLCFLQWPNLGVLANLCLTSLVLPLLLHWQNKGNLPVFWVVLSIFLICFFVHSALTFFNIVCVAQ